MLVAVVACATEVSLTALPGLPRVGAGDDIAAQIESGLRRAGMTLAPHDVLVITSKLLSRSDNRWVDLSRVTPGAEALQLAGEVHKDPALVECILRESQAVSRKAPGVLIVRHRLGFVCANAGIDASNAQPVGATPGSGPWVLLLPLDPDADARRIRAQLEQTWEGPLGVVISDSHGRPFRVGTVGTAIGVAGLPPLFVQVGRPDLDGRPLEHTSTGLADQLAAAADLVAGQADEGRPVVRVRGLRFTVCEAGGAAELQRSLAEDLYA